MIDNHKDGVDIGANHKKLYLVLVKPSFRVDLKHQNWVLSY
jgi:hypothetical protein